MDIADCYRVLGVTSVASAKEIKSSYRRLARKWHPDVNPDNQHAHDMFIQVTAAYKVLLGVIPSSTSAPTTPPRTHTSSPPQTTPTQSPSPTSPSQKVYRTPPSSQSASPTSRPNVPPRQRATGNPTPRSTTKPTPKPETNPRPDPAYQIKLRAYDQLQSFLKMKRYPRAIALIEALSQKLPEDPEIKQWQAIIYQRWGRQLITERKYNQARAYLKKAFNTDPKNKSLLAEIERDLKAIQTSV